MCLDVGGVCSGLLAALPHHHAPCASLNAGHACAGQERRGARSGDVQAGEVGGRRGVSFGVVLCVRVELGAAKKPLNLHTHTYKTTQAQSAVDGKAGEAKE